MELILAIVMVVIGFLFLVKGADFLVKGAQDIAIWLKISPLLTGLCLLAPATSAPELAVNISAAFQGVPDVALGNVIGSNIANISLALGIGALVRPLIFTHSTVNKDIPFSFLAITSFLILGFDRGFDRVDHNILSVGDGLILLSFSIVFFAYLYFSAKSGEPLLAFETPPRHKVRPIYAILLFMVGLMGAIVGGNLVVIYGAALSRMVGISELFVGLFITSVGTSLPEIVTTVVALSKGSDGIATGNIIGSNIFNIFVILGLTATIRPLMFQEKLLADTFFLLSLTILLFFIVKTSRSGLQRRHGVVFISGYIGYLVFLLARG